jgi:hypothetical protein
MPRIRTPSRPPPRQPPRLCSACLVDAPCEHSQHCELAPTGEALSPHVTAPAPISPLLTDWTLNRTKHLGIHVEYTSVNFEWCFNTSYGLPVGFWIWQGHRESTSTPWGPCREYQRASPVRVLPKAQVASPSSMC